MPQSSVRPPPCPEAPRGRGRPAMPAGAVRNDTLRIRVSAQELAAVQACADHAGLPLSTWVRQVMLAPSGVRLRA